MSVNLLEVMAAARAHRAPLPGECVGYLVLAVADQVLGTQASVRLADVELGSGGTVRVRGGERSSPEACEQALRNLLSELMTVANPTNAALERVIHRPSGSGVEALISELEAALIPVNRAAAQRALARLERETLRGLAEKGLPAERPLAPPPKPSKISEVVDDVEILEIARVAQRSPSPVEPQVMELLEMARDPMADRTTMPEPVMLRAAQRAGRSLGSEPSQARDELSGQAEPCESPRAPNSEPSFRVPDDFVSCTLTIPSARKPPVSHSVARKSQVSELLQNFRVGEGDSEGELSAALKELAGVDQSPSPLAGIVRRAR